MIIYYFSQLCQDDCLIDGKNLIIRIFNPTNKSSSSILKWDGIKMPRIFLSNGDEEELQQIRNKIQLDPFEVITLKIKE